MYDQAEKTLLENLNSKSLNKENRIKLADQISFRLLATRKHEDHSWLVNILKAKKEKTTGSIKRFFKFFLIFLPIINLF